MQEHGDPFVTPPGQRFQSIHNGYLCDGSHNSHPSAHQPWMAAMPGTSVEQPHAIPLPPPPTMNLRPYQAHLPFDNAIPYIPGLDEDLSQFVNGKWYDKYLNDDSVRGSAPPRITSLELEKFDDEFDAQLQEALKVTGQDRETESQRASEPPPKVMAELAAAKELALKPKANGITEEDKAKPAVEEEQAKPVAVEKEQAEPVAVEEPKELSESMNQLELESSNSELERSATPSSSNPWDEARKALGIYDPEASGSPPYFCNGRGWASLLGIKPRPQSPPANPAADWLPLRAGAIAGLSRECPF